MPIFIESIPVLTEAIVLTSVTALGDYIFSGRPSAATENLYTIACDIASFILPDDGSCKPGDAIASSNVPPPRVEDSSHRQQGFFYIEIHYMTSTLSHLTNSFY
jgi:hypothetical protein